MKNLSLTALLTPPCAERLLVVNVRIADLDVVGPDVFPATEAETFSEHRGYLQTHSRVINSRDSKQMIRSWSEDLFDTPDRI